MALLLGIMGIYGVISYSVSQRTREIGIRIALGAPQQTVRRMFVREGLAADSDWRGLRARRRAGADPPDERPCCSKSARSTPSRTLPYPSILAAAALLASYIPARRATNIEPMEALRVE